MKPKLPVIAVTTPANDIDTDAQVLVSDLRQLINTSRAQLAGLVNSALTLLYWQIGYRINSEVLNGARAGYGEQIVLTLSRHLEATAPGVVEQLRQMIYPLAIAGALTLQTPATKALNIPADIELLE